MTDSNPGIELERGFVRVVGVRALAASIFNVTVGGGIFVLPAVVAGISGAAAPLAYVVCALAMGLIALCFAEAGSRVSLTGGPYAYVEIALGPIAGLLAGTLLWLLGTLAAAAVASAFAAAIAVFWPPLGTPVARGAILVLLFVALAAINIRGTREGTRLVEVVTVAKLLPLLLLIVAGLALGGSRASGAIGPVSAASLGRSVMVLVFAFAGLESALVPSGEIRHPARTVPRALLIAMIAVTALYVLLQYVAQRTLGVEQLAHETGAPLAAAARVLAGETGAMVIAAGAAISMFGYVSGMMLAIPRAVYAFGRDGILPPILGRVHPRFHTPAVAIAVHAAVVLGLALTSGFVRLVVLSNVSVLVLYLMCCISTIQLRRLDVRSAGNPLFLPGGPVIPLAASAVVLWILAQATIEELATVGAVLLGSLFLFGANRLRPGPPRATFG